MNTSRSMRLIILLLAISTLSGCIWRVEDGGRRGDYHERDRGDYHGDHHEDHHEDQHEEHR